MRFREVYLWIGVSVAILCMWVLFFCIPFAKQIEVKKKELNNLEVMTSKTETELSRPTEAKEDGTGKAKLNNTPDQIPRLEAFPDFMRRVALSVRNGGVTIDRLNGRLDDDDVRTGSTFAYPVTKMDVTGRFLDIGRVLEQIQGVRAYRRIVRAHLTAEEDTYPDLRGTVEIEFKAWRD